MRFLKSFKRQKGSASTDPVLGLTTDPAPLYSANPSAPSANKDNVMSFKTGGIGNAIKRVAIGYRFSAGSGVALTATLWVYEKLTEQWYQASTGTLNDGQLTYFKVPVPADGPQNTANGTAAMLAPTAGGVDCLLSVADPGAGAAVGVYIFTMAPDLSEF